ncbi:cadherin-like beta sandwich domain-containing protein [Paenibacillus sp. 2TAB23]|uniref:cadherin-like beta sandwich domain-containing protein n=1 Tax=Paenibacillus sp. 2TAB23 TaxID=3233004 RepID=UPI003F9843C1
MDNVQSPLGTRKNVRAFLAIVVFVAVLLQALSVHSQTVFAASDWRMGAGAGHPAALGFEPYGLDVDPINGYLFVTDDSNFAVKIFDLDGTATGMTLTASSGSFTDPLAIKFDGAGHVYVTDKWYVYRFDVTFSSGTYMFSNMIKWDGISAAPSVGRLDYPQGIAVFGNDLYIADTYNNRVLKFDVSTFSPMSNPVVWSGDVDPDPAVNATIQNPFGIAADSSGVYIGNNVNMNGKIIKVMADGSTLTKAIYRPYGFSLHTDGYLYVAANGSSGSLVTRFDSSLNEIGEYFGGNSGAIAPTNIGFDDTGALYLSTYAQMVPYDLVYDTVWKLSLGAPDNRLTGLTASDITLIPSPFSPNTLDYTASVASGVTSTKITPVLSDSTASVTINGTSVTSGSASSPIALNKGDNSIQVVVTANNGAKRNYTIKVTRAPYADATLSGLAVSSGALNETFAAGTLAYTANVANSVASIDVTPTVNNSRSTLKVNNMAAASGSASTVTPLVVGPNTITISVTAEDGTTSNDYTIIVTRAPSAVATLGSLTVSQGGLNETFASGTTAYTANVANSVNTISVTPTVSNSSATLKVNSVSSVSGSVYGPIPLNVGPNTITIDVTAQDGVTTSSYSIVVTRAPSSAATLSGLTISPGSFNETFATGTTAYTANVANSVNTISITPTVSDNSATLKINGISSVSGSTYGPIPLNVGPNTITTVVTAQDGVTTSSYSIVVTRAPSSAATLSGLTISPGSFNETFASGTTTYTASVANNVAEINVIPTVSDSTASLKVNGETSVSGSVYGPIPLEVGPNTITTVVTAQDGVTTRSYSIVVTRAPSSAATLSGLSISPGTLNEPFDSETLAYTANVESGISSISVTPVVAESHATITINGVTAANGSVFGPIALKTGLNTVTVVVTAQDGVTQRSYRLDITRLSTTGSQPEQPSGDSGTVKPPIVLNDISGHWAEAEIRKAVADGWVSGYPDGSFKPKREVTRAEFVLMLAKSQGWKESDAESVAKFSDIDNIGEWAQTAVSMAVQMGMINGYEDGSFRPNQPITRAEMTQMIIRTLGMSVELDQSTSFADNSNISAWSLPYIAEAVKRGLVKGLDNNRFEPNRKASRAEAVVILTRLLNHE